MARVSTTACVVLGFAMSLSVSANATLEDFIVADSIELCLDELGVPTSGWSLACQYWDSDSDLVYDEDLECTEHSLTSHCDVYVATIDSLDSVWDILATATLTNDPDTSGFGLINHQNYYYDIDNIPRLQGWRSCDNGTVYDDYTKMACFEYQDPDNQPTGFDYTTPDNSPFPVYRAEANLVRLHPLRPTPFTYAVEIWVKEG